MLIQNFVFLYFTFFFLRSISLRSQPRFSSGENNKCVISQRAQETFFRAHRFYSKQTRMPVNKYILKTKFTIFFELYISTCWRYDIWYFTSCGIIEECANSRLSDNCVCVSANRIPVKWFLNCVFFPLSLQKKTESENKSRCFLCVEELGYTRILILFAFHAEYYCTYFVLYTCVPVVSKRYTSTHASKPIFAHQTAIFTRFVLFHI